MEQLDVHIDIETYSEVDLKKVGLMNYAYHPSTRIELASWAIGNDPVQTWDIWDQGPVPLIFNEPPKELYELLSDPQFHYKAFNAPFEKTLIEACWGLLVPNERWYCVMVHSYMMGFSGGLAEVGRQIGIPQDKQKLAEGNKLVLKFCKPAPKTHRADRYGPWNAPEQWSKYKTYNAQDVIAEREIDALLEPYPVPERERRLWLLDRKINERGLPIDTQLVANAAKVNDAEILRLKKELNQHTGLANGNSTQQLLPWLKLHGVDMPNMQKATVERFLKKDISDKARRALLLRQQASQTSTAKYKAVLQAVHNGRLHNTLQFGGAQRTQRWAGRLFQPHNLKRGYEDADKQADLLANTDDSDFIRLMVGDVMDYLSNIMRTIVTAPEGKKLVVNDYGSIESRVLGWISGCHRINNCFATGRDTYKDFAAEFFSVPYEQVTKEQRTFSKPAVLGCGYQLGPDTLIEYAKGMGVKLSPIESRDVVNLWRELHPEVVQMWHWLIETCKRVVTDGIARQGYGCVFYRDTKFLFIRLPSTRSIAYYMPSVIPCVPPWEAKKQREYAAVGEDYTPKMIPTLTYMGKNQYTGKWERLTTHGGKTTENIVQGIARDILGDHMVDLDLQEFQIVGHVHDEVLDEAKEHLADTELDVMQGTMSTTTYWAPGLLLETEGFTTKRYKKA